MPGNNSDTQAHNGNSLAELADQVRDISSKLEELIQLSHRARAQAAATKKELDPRELIAKALSDRMQSGKSGGLTMAEIRTLLGTGNSSAKHHVDALVRQGKAVVVIRLGEHGKGRQEVCHPDAVAI